jgi:hypothetical protein
MPHVIHKASNVCTYHASVELLADPHWKDPAWPGDPNYHVNIPGLRELHAAGVPERYVTAVDVGGGVFEAQELGQAAKDALDLPVAKAAKLTEIDVEFAAAFEAKLASTLRSHWPRNVEHLPGIRDALIALVTAATTPVEVQAIVVAYADPVDAPSSPADVLHLSATGDSPVLTANGWTKIGSVTSNQVKDGTAFSDRVSGAHVDNLIRLKTDATIRLFFGATWTIGGAACTVEVAISRNGGNPSAAYQRFGFGGSGVVGDVLTGASTGVVNATDGDTFEVYARCIGGGSSAVFNRLFLSASRL